MKKPLLTLFAAVLSAMAAVAAVTPAPVITIENVGNHNEFTIFKSRYQEICFFTYKVTATGEGDVHLILNGEEVENPYTLTFRGDTEAYQYETNQFDFVASAQADGCELSYTEKYFEIPCIPLFNLSYDEENEAISMVLFSNEGATIKYKVGHGGEWQDYEGPFEVWRAPQCIHGSCYVEVMGYAGDISSNMGIRHDLNEFIGAAGIYRYYELDGGIYYAYKYMGHDDGTGIVFAPDYSSMCNRYWEPDGHPACYSGDVVVPETIEHILDHTFYNCSELTSVTIPNTVTYIGEEAFIGCTSLERVVIDDLYSWCRIVFNDSLSNPLFYADQFICQGEPVTDLEFGWDDDFCFNAYSMAGYKGLKSITFRSELPPQADVDAFYGLYDQVTLYVPYDNLEMYKADLEWSRFTRIVPFIGAGPGDIDGSGGIDVDDVTGIIGMILDGTVPEYADVNGDGAADIDDITAIINMLLNGH